MADEETTLNPQDDPSSLMLVVVGAHLRAEVADRPLAYRLRDRVNAWLERHAPGLNIPIVPIVCSDIWYMNQESLQHRPTISIGGTGVNALSAYWWSQKKVSSADIDENQPIIQLDPEFTDLRVAIWGMNHDMTVNALEFFIRKHLDGYLRAVVTQVEPLEDG